MLAVVASRSGAIPVWQSLAGSSLGLCALGVGLWLIYQSPGTRVAINREERMLTLSRRGLLRRQVERHDLASVEHVYLLQSRDIDGDPVYSLRMMMSDGKEVPLTLLWLHGKEKLTAILEQIGQFIPTSGIRIEEK